MIVFTKHEPLWNPALKPPRTVMRWIGRLGILSSIICIILKSQITFDPLVLLLFYRKPSRKKVNLCLIMCFIFVAFAVLDICLPGTVTFMRRVYPWTWFAAFVYAAVWCYVAYLMHLDLHRRRFYQTRKQGKPEWH